MQAIGEALDENGRVLVTGCLGANPQRILERHPKVLGVTGPHAYDRVIAEVDAHLPAPHAPFINLIPPQGIRLARGIAYLKISEGCNNRCSFCIIPALRGDLVSRPLDHVMREAETLVASGVRELLVIPPAIPAPTAPDILPRRDVAQPAVCLAHRRSGARALQARCLGCSAYVYPYPHVDDLIPLMNESGVLPYLDIPFQHGSPTVLKRMRRPAHAENTLRRIEALACERPELTLRSTFIVGFPGETEQEFEELLAWLLETAAQLDRVGAAQYSAVEGAAANAVGAAIPEEVKQARYERFMERAGAISAARLAARVGTHCRVLVDSIERGVAIARSAADARDRWGRLPGAFVGEFAEVMIVAADTYDLTAETLTPPAAR